jgi:hypothetical protein
MSCLTPASAAAAVTAAARISQQLMAHNADAGYHAVVCTTTRATRAGNHAEFASIMKPIEVPNASNSRRSRGGFGRWLLLLLVLIIGGAFLWTWLTLSWAYAEGERAGVLQKFVRRGWLCKTQEGEIALYYGGGQYLGPGSSPQLWDFSVRDKSVAAQLTSAVGHRVQLHYTEHPGVPTECFADTRYFVDHVTITDEEPAANGAAAAGGAGGVPPAGTPTQAPPPPPAASAAH